MGSKMYTIDKHFILTKRVLQNCCIKIEKFHWFITADQILK